MGIESSNTHTRNGAPGSAGILRTATARDTKVKELSISPAHAFTDWAFYRFFDWTLWHVKLLPVSFALQTDLGSVTPFASWTTSSCSLILGCKVADGLAVRWESDGAFVRMHDAKRAHAGTQMLNGGSTTEVGIKAKEIRHAACVVPVPMGEKCIGECRIERFQSRSVTALECWRKKSTTLSRFCRAACLSTDAPSQDR